MSTASGQAHIRPAPARHEVGQGGPTPLGLGPLRNWHLLARLARVLGLDALVRVAVAGYARSGIGTRTSRSSSTSRW